MSLCSRGCCGPLLALLLPKLIHAGLENDPDLMFFFVSAITPSLTSLDAYTLDLCSCHAPDAFMTEGLHYIGQTPRPENGLQER
jgi:hypothetical protein